MNTYYKKLKLLVEKDQLSIKLILSPPRTGSTMLETALSHSSDVTMECHEPFIKVLSKSGLDLGFKNIYQLASSDNKNEKVVIVIKELANRLGTGKAFRQICKLSDAPVLFLIRNPLLSMESRLRKIIVTMNTKDRLILQGWLKIKLCKSSSQTELLDLYSVKLGYKDWKNVLNELELNKDYSKLQELLFAEKGRLIIDPDGRNSLESQMKSLDKSNLDYTILDSTDFRLNPKNALNQICHLWSIRYGDNMINWEEGKLRLRRGDEEIKDYSWYDTLYKSGNILLPNEKPIPLSNFPKRIKTRLKNHDLPQYIRLLKHKKLIKLSKNKAFIKKVDPVYSVIKFPELLKNRQYLKKNEKYLVEFKIINENK
jgi:hypothetical protein